MSNPPFAAVLFDADGVLQRVPPTWRERLVGLVGSNDPDRGQRFLDDVMAAEQPTLTGESDFVETLAEVLDRWGVRAPAEQVRNLWDQVHVDPEMIDAVRALRRTGVRCGLATNQHTQRAAYMQRALGYERVFDPRVYSCAIGLAKPDPAYFRYAVSLLGVPPDQVLFIDDTRPNVEGAREAGLVAEYFSKDGGRPELERVLTPYGWSGAGWVARP